MSVATEVEAALSDVTPTQDGVERASAVLQRHAVHVKTVVGVWARELKESESQRLALLYVASDAIQKRARRGDRRFVEGFEGEMAEAMRLTRRTPSHVKNARRLVTVWRDRRIFPRGVCAGLLGVLVPPGSPPGSPASDEEEEDDDEDDDEPAFVAAGDDEEDLGGIEAPLHPQLERAASTLGHDVDTALLKVDWAAPRCAELRAAVDREVRPLLEADGGAGAAALGEGDLARVEQLHAHVGSLKRVLQDMVKLHGPWEAEVTAAMEANDAEAAGLLPERTELCDLASQRLARVQELMQRPEWAAKRQRIEGEREAARAAEEARLAAEAEAERKRHAEEQAQRLNDIVQAPALPAQGDGDVPMVWNPQLREYVALPSATKEEAWREH